MLESASLHRIDMMCESRTNKVRILDREAATHAVWREPPFPYGVAPPLSWRPWWCHQPSPMPISNIKLPCPPALTIDAHYHTTTSLMITTWAREMPPTPINRLCFWWPSLQMNTNFVLRTLFSKHSVSRPLAVSRHCASRLSRQTLLAGVTF